MIRIVLCWNIFFDATRLELFRQHGILNKLDSKLWIG